MAAYSYKVESAKVPEAAYGIMSQGFVISFSQFVVLYCCADYVTYSQ